MTRAGNAVLASRAARGFTFVELVISLVVIGIAVTGVLLVFTHTVSSSADPLIRQQALAIAEAYVEEIVSKRYDADGVEMLRGDYDDVDDYAGMSEAPTRGNGNAIAQLTSYLVDVNVTTTTLNGVSAKRIDVTVSHPSGESISLWSYRTDYN